MSLLRGALLLTALIIIAPAAAAMAQSAENVAVVINDLSPDSQRIGEHYARTRGVPPSNVLRIQTTPNDSIERDTYVRTIERPLGRAITRAALQDRLLFIVLTKGVPLRIVGTAGLQGSSASVDSELTLLYRRLTGQAVPPDGAIDNPYFLGTHELREARPFSHREHDIYLVTRLDAFTVDEALALVDRAQTPRAQGQIILDQRADPPASEIGDEWLQLAARRLTAQGHEQRVLLETTPKAVRGVDAVVGLYSWGAADPEHRTRVTGMKFVPGAIAANLASLDARTFRLPPAAWQPTASVDRAAWFEGSGDALIGDLIREGVTGVSGQVGEAFRRGAVRPEILFPAYVAGFTLAEAFYLALPTLSWQAVVVGDPLAAPFGGRRLTRGELEEDIDGTTGLPGAFSRRRIATLAATNRDVPAAALSPVVRALALLDNDDKAGAGRALAEAIKLAPRLPNWLVSLASLQEQAGEYAAAVATYQDVVSLQPGNVVALNNAAYALAVYLGKPAEALPLANRAVSLAPRVGTIIDTLAWTEHLLGEHAVAAKLLADAIRLEPRQAEIRLHAAIVYAALKQWDRADAELKEALRLDPGLETREEVRRLRQRGGPGSEARGSTQKR
jgi:uncharacterized protein (TIGR03790 family)